MCERDYSITKHMANDEISTDESNMNYLMNNLMNRKKKKKKKTKNNK
jgi:hypothetical protein